MELVPWMNLTNRSRKWGEARSALDHILKDDPRLRCLDGASKEANGFTFNRHASLKQVVGKCNNGGWCAIFCTGIGCRIKPPMKEEKCANCVNDTGELEHEVNLVNISVAVGDLTVIGPCFQATQYSPNIEVKENSDSTDDNDNETAMCNESSLKEIGQQLQENDIIAWKGNKKMRLNDAVRNDELINKTKQTSNVFENVLSDKEDVDLAKLLRELTQE